MSGHGSKRAGSSGRKVHHAVDLIALGSKSSSSKPPPRHPTATDSDDGVKSTKPSTSLGTSSNPAKKFKPGADTPGGLFSDPIRVSQVNPPTSTSGKQPSSSKVAHNTSPQTSSGSTPHIIEVRPGELISAIKAAKSADNDVKVSKILGGALKQLKLSRLKPDTTLNSALVSLVHEYPEIFTTPAAIEALVLVLKREPSIIFKARSNPSVYVVASQLLVLALKDSKDWPEVVAKVYIEDALGDRVWVDLDACKELTANICTLFATKPYTTSVSAAGSKGGEQGKAGVSGDVGEGSAAEVAETTLLSGVETTSRFSASSRKALKAYILQLVNEQLGRHSMPADNVSRNLLKFLISAVGLAELRLLVAQKIDSWIQNPKLGKQCQELLMTVAVNCHAHSQEDIKVIEALINIRLKTKLFSSQFVSCIKELISSHPQNFETVMRGVVNNELGQFRSPSNMALISMMLHSWPDDAAKLLGSMFQEFLTRKEDYLRALRGFLREVVRVIRTDFNFMSFVRSLMQERSEAEFSQLETNHKERMMHSLADLICTASMLTANMLIREAYSGYHKGDRAMVAQLQDFFSTLGLVQRDSVWWIHTVVPSMFRPQPVEYKACLRKLLFLESAEMYSRDNWPPESDRSLIYKMMGESCLKEDTLMRVLVIGLTRDLPLFAADAMDIADVLVARAANASTDDIQRLPSIERKEFFSAIFDIAIYRPPANIQLPEGYHPPALAISKLYWKGWLLLLVLSAFNPKTIGAMGWNEYPLLRGMMEMVMTNNFGFPMSMNLEVNGDGVTESKDSAVMKEMQLARSEKEAILEYENHLASSSGQKLITESSSYLVNQVTKLNPKGPARKLPQSVIELVKTVNRSLKLGQLLCRCRSPDFLLNIIKRQGTLESMKWLTDLVESSHSSMEVLPVPCLCEFLLASYQEHLSGTSAEGDTDPNSHRSRYKRKKSSKDKAFERHKQLIEQLQSLISGPKSSPQSSGEVLSYFFEKLTLSHLTPRKLAISALHDILVSSGEVSRTNSSLSCFSDDSDEMDNYFLVKDGEWLVSCLPNVAHFAVILPQIYPFLLQACLVETNLACLQHYLLFLSQNYPHEKLSESVIGISRLIVDRFDILKKILSPSCEKPQGDVRELYNLQLLASLFELFHCAMDAAIHSQSMPRLSGNSEFLLVSFPAFSQKAILHITFIQAVFLLLSLNPPQGTAYSDYTYLLDLWLPIQPLNRPDVSSIEGKDKVSLPPEDVLNSTLLSTDTRLLEASIQAAKPALLCKLIQQMGCPIRCLEKVVEFLENSCRTDSSVAAEIHHCVLEPMSLARCVEIQMCRGLQSGKELIAFLQSLTNSEPSDVDTCVVSDADCMIGSNTSLSPHDKSSTVKDKPHLSSLKPYVQKSMVSSEQERIILGSCENIKRQKNPFDNESSLIKLSCSVSRNVSTVWHLENVILALARRSVHLGLEKQCIDLLQSINTAVGSSSIAFQCCPELFSSSVRVHDRDVICRLDVFGLFVDILELLDPDIVALSPEASMRFLFGYSETEKKTKSPAQSGILLSGQGYLLARLVNNTSWCTLLSAIGLLLDSQKVKEWINPSAVLDFLWACLHKPCLWQEKVKKEAIVNSSLSLGVDEDSEMTLTPQQLEVVVDYILKESASALEVEDVSALKPDTVDMQISPEVTCLLHSRLPLLISCCSRGKSLGSLVQYLQTNSNYPSLSWQLLVHLYHANEKVIFVVDHPSPLTMSALNVATSSKMDSSLHYLISAMADAQPGQANHQKISTAALLCCKLTLHHPALMLRQLPMLGWMLKGRAHLKPGEFRNRNHKLVFENVFTLLEMLQPLVFKDSQVDSLNLCLEAFFDFMKNHCSESKKYQDIVNRFSDFLVEYAQHNREKAAGILYKNLDVLRSLNEVYTNKKSSLKFLVDCFPKSSKTCSSVAPVTLMMTFPTATSFGLTHEQIMPFLRKIENGQQIEDILKVLQDVKETSLHSVDILKHFVPELCRIILEPVLESCTLAHDLLIRHLKYSPESIDEVLPSFIACLESHDYTVVKAAVPSLPDILLLCKGSDAIYLLKLLFLLATHSSYNCTTELVKCVESFTHHTK